MIQLAYTSKTIESKINEMTKLVRDLTAKLNNLEIDKNPNKPTPEGERNPNHFRCPTIKLSVEHKDELWQMYFDGSSSKEGAGAGVGLASPGGEAICLMYKLEFVTTNNTLEYEALILRLRAAKDLGIQHISVYGNSELVVQHVRDKYQVKQDLLKVYSNEVWDMIENDFVAFNIYFILRDHDQRTDSLALETRHFKIPKQTQLKYLIEIRYRPSVPDNIRQWRVFKMIWK